MKNFTNNFKRITSRLSARWLIMAFMLLAGSGSAWAGGSAGGPAGVYLEINNTTDWYNIYSTNWGYDPCSGWDFKNATKIGQGDDEVKDFGTVTSFKLKGFGIIGWCDGTDWVSGQLRYQVNSNSQQYYKVCNYGDCNSGRYSDHEVCKSNNDRVVGYKNSDIDLLTGLTPGEHTIKFKAYGQNLWNNNGSCGDFNSVDHSEKSATFTVPGYSTTTGDKDFGEVDVNSSSDYTIELTHYGSDNTASVSITGTNKSEFTATIEENGDNKQTLTVTFNPTTEDSNKTATITVTDAYDKTYTLEVTGTGKQSCQDPTLVSITRSDAPSTANICQGSTINLTAAVTGGSGNISYVWTKTSGGNDWTIDNASAQKCTVTAGTGSAQFKIEATQCEKTVEATIELTADAKPSLELASSPTVCPNVQIDLDNYINLSIGTVTWYYDDNRANVITDGLVTPTEQTTYYASCTNGVCNAEEKELIVKVYEVPMIPEFSVKNETKCGNTSKKDGSITITPVPGVTYTLTKETAEYTINNNTWSGLATGNYTLTATLNACAELHATETISVGLTNNTPTVNSFAITKQDNVCMGNPVTLSYNGTAQSGTISYAWYEGDSEVVIGTESTLTIQQAKNASYKLVVTVTSNDCPASAEATTTVEPKAVPSAPTFDDDAMDACVNQPFTLPMPNNLKYEEEPLWTVNERPTTASQTINVAGEYTYTAYKNDGCPSQGTPFTVTVNPLPTINIGENVTAVLYEDVVLTATGNNIADVTWIADKGTITKDATDPKKAVLTYDQADAVIVAATATSTAGCTSVEATKTVTFDEEVCNNVADMTKIYFDATDNPSFVTGSYVYVTITGKKDNNNSNGSTSCSGDGVDTSGGNQGNYVPKNDSWWGQMKKVAGESYIFEITIPNDVTITKGTTKLSFWNNKIDNYSDVYNVQAILGQKTSSGTNCMKLYSNKTHNNDRSSDFYCGTWIKYENQPEITTPAVKMLSAFSEEGSGELSMTAQIVKTGCNGNMTYYFKYRLKDAQAWNQTTTQTATGLEAGDEINETVSGLNQGGTYEIQAVINNNNEAESNIIEYVVNIEETAISDVTLQFADGKGSVYQDQNKIYCVGSTAYIKLSYDGTAHKSLEWIAENELQPVDDIDKLFSYVVRGNETITANVANDENKGTPATGTIDINVYTIATTPDISIDRTEVCSSDQVGAKITVNAPQIGITYQAYKIVGDVETTHGEPVVADNAESIVINSIKETGTYYVKAWNAQCPDAIAVSLLKFAVTKIDASSNTIAISPESASTNPWMPITVKVDKNSAYDYTLVCKQENTDVTDQMVINKKGDSYVIKFPKPESAEIDEDGQVVFDDIEYSITVSLNGNVECGVTSATSTVTLTKLIENCD